MLIHILYASRYCNVMVVSFSLRFMYIWNIISSTTMCTPDVPFTPSNVMRKVKEVRRWWGNGSLTYYLCIPKSKQEEIKRNFPDEMEQKKQSISYLTNTDPLAGWRRLISALDRIHLAPYDPILNLSQLHCPSMYCNNAAGLANLKILPISMNF